jgi:dolichyl-phosphate beta-glucosyltransferase
MKRRTAFAISVVVSALILGAALMYFDLRQMVEFVRHARRSLMLAGVGLTVAAYVLRGRMRSLARTKAAGVRQPASGALSVVEETRASLRQLGASVELKPAPRYEIHLSIVIPAYNEQARLPRTLLETIRWGTARNINFEIVVADDGSRDETLAIGRLFEESDVRVRVLACPHLGKGAAVRTGMLNANGRFILFMDADGATPLTEIGKLFAAVEAGHDVAIGSRVALHPSEVEVRTSLHRRLIGRTFAFLVGLFAVEGIRDTQCGFKMFRREAAVAIFSRQKTVGFAFDVEILLIAHRLSLPIAEIPVNWVAQPGSKVNLVADSIRMLRDISRLRWLHRNFDASPSPLEGELARLKLAGLGAPAAQAVRTHPAPSHHPVPGGAEYSPDAGAAFDAERRKARAGS